MTPDNELSAPDKRTRDTQQEEQDIYKDIAVTLISAQVIKAISKTGLFAELDAEQHRRKLENEILAPYQLRKIKFNLKR